MNFTASDQIRLQGNSESIMVQLREFRWHQDPCGDARALPVLTPSHTIPSTSAHYVGKSLEQHQIDKREEFAQTAKWLVVARESDAAASNLSHIQQDSLSLPLNAFLVHFLCLLHQLYLVVYFLLTLTGLDGKLELVTALCGRVSSLGPVRN